MDRKTKTFFRRIVYSSAFDYLSSIIGIKALLVSCRVSREKKKLLASAKKAYDCGSGKGTYNDYRQALRKHWISYNEYAFQYDFPHKTEKEREEFVTRLKMCYFSWRFIPGEAKSLFLHKHKFLRLFKKDIHREWLYTPEASFEEFVSLISKHDCIVKPCDETRGHGIFKINKNDPDIDAKKLFESCVRNRLLVEQCIESCKELSVFHPQSLNTIRVVTVSNKNNAEVFGAFLRIGVGDSIVDNAHAGGIFAQINVKTGEIESEGINTDGIHFAIHPDSHLKIKGFIVPQWNLICKTCCEAAVVTENTITGWDVIVNNQDQIEFVEGNNCPDFDVMQSPLQIGVKKRLYALIEKYRGISLS